MEAVRSSETSLNLQSTIRYILDIHGCRHVHFKLQIFSCGTDKSQVSTEALRSFYAKTIHCFANLRDTNTVLPPPPATVARS
jgi:hypothetical protein